VIGGTLGIAVRPTGTARCGRTKEVQMFGTLGLPELLILLAIVVLIFGVNKLPRLGKGLGEGIRNFKDSVKSEKPPSDSDSSPDASAEKSDS
jgi:sec-independent protein translocase protein TatA